MHTQHNCGLNNIYIHEIAYSVNVIGQCTSGYDLSWCSCIACPAWYSCVVSVFVYSCVCVCVYCLAIIYKQNTHRSLQVRRTVCSHGQTGLSIKLYRCLSLLSRDTSAADTILGSVSAYGAEYCIPNSIRDGRFNKKENKYTRSSVSAGKQNRRVMALRYTCVELVVVKINIIQD